MSSFGQREKYAIIPSCSLYAYRFTNQTMSEDIATDSFYGSLGRVTPTATGFSLRVYPFLFQNDPNLECVYLVEAKGTRISADQISSLLGKEIEITVSTTSVLIDEWLTQRETVMPAKNATARFVTYDLQDFVDRVTGLENAWKQEYSERVKAERKLSNISALLEELSRRANIKSNANDEQQTLQAAALRILDRLRTELESDRD